MAGSGLFHLALLSALVQGYAIHEPGSGHGDPFLVPVSPVGASFALPARLPIADDWAHVVLNDRRCGGPGLLDREPALVGFPMAGGRSRSVSVPRLCVRVGADGRVLAARVLRSSGRRATDDALETRVRGLSFTPAVRGDRAVPATVTLDVVGWHADGTRSMGVPVSGPLIL